MLKKINSPISHNTQLFQAITNEQAVLTSGGAETTNIPIPGVGELKLNSVFLQPTNALLPNVFPNIVNPVLDGVNSSLMPN